MNSNKMRNHATLEAKRMMQDEGCVVCGTKMNLTLHHIDQRRPNKANGKRNSFYAGSAKQRITELAKCIPLCKSCHAYHHGTKTPIEEMRRLRKPFRRLSVMNKPVKRYTVPEIEKVYWEEYNKLSASRSEYV